jgi:hypothetical protein
LESVRMAPAQDACKFDPEVTSGDCEGVFGWGIHRDSRRFRGRPILLQVRGRRRKSESRTMRASIPAVGRR